MSSHPSDTNHQGTPASAYYWVLFAYVVALAAGAAVLMQTIVPLADNLLLRVLIADCVATLVIFGFSCAFANASFYDAYWSVAPPVLFGYFFVAQDAQLDLRATLLFALVLAWAVRLTHNWARGWQGLSHADWRYVDLQASTGPFWWLINLLGIHLFPTLLVFLGCIAIQVSLAGDARAINGVDLLASVIGWSALWLEMTADNQLRAFRQTNVNSATTLATGVWAWCRHPNYLGEIGFWLALFIYAWAAVGTQALALAVWGPLAMLALFAGISIPMIDKHLANRKGFAEHKARTFALLPFSQLKRRKQ